MTCPGIEGFQNRCGYVVYVEVYNYFCQNCLFNGKSLFFLLIETLEIEKSSCFVGASFSFNYKQKQEKLSCVWKVHGSGFHLRKNTAPHENLMFLSFLSF